jgi:uncharacterized protein YndB with AHSA1/START domain
MITRAEAERIVNAPPAVVYGVLADYRTHHPRIMPAPPFSNLDVESGGVGRGTVFHITVRMFGRNERLHMRVSEPQPGRVLTETNLETGEVTEFTVTPEDDGARSHVRIRSSFETAAGWRGAMDRRLKPAIVGRLLGQQLQQLDRYIQGQEKRAS